MARILQIVNNRALAGGIGTAIDYLAKPSLAREYSTAVLTWQADELGREGHEIIKRENATFDDVIQSSRFLAQELAQYDLLHIHSIPSYRILEVIDILQQEGRCPKIVNTCHSSVKKELVAHLERSRGTPDGNDVEEMIQQGMMDCSGKFMDTYWGSAIYRQERVMTLADKVQHMNEAYRDNIITEYRAEEVRKKHMLLSIMELV